MKKRRELIFAIGAGVAILPHFVSAQQPGRVYRIGYLVPGGNRNEPYAVAFVHRLSEAGLIEGSNLVIEFRTAEGRVERLPALAAELAKRNCDVFVVPGSQANLVAVQQATRDTPIVIIAVDYDPLATGHIASLALPGGRVTGVSALQSVLPAKRIELLKELLPKARTFAVFSDTQSTEQLEVARDGAKRLGLELQVFEFRRAPYDYEAAFAKAAQSKAEALLMLGSANFVPARSLITRLAIKYRLPSMFHHSVWAEAGGLLSYGPNFSELYRRAAEQVIAILKGAKPANIPVEQPTKFELIINMKTAKALGISIPQSILLRADKTIE